MGTQLKPMTQIVSRHIRGNGCTHASCIVRVVWLVSTFAEGKTQREGASGSQTGNIPVKRDRSL